MESDSEVLEVLFWELLSVLSRMFNKARNDIANAHYSYDTTNFTFDDYCTKHLAAYNELERRGVAIDGPSQVIAFLQGIKRDQFQNIKPGIINSDRTRDNLVNAVTELKKQLGMIYNYDSQKPAARHRDQRSIGSVQRGGGGHAYARGS